MLDFKNETIDIDSLPKYEETSLNSPDSKYWKVILINIFIFLIILCAANFTILYINELLTVKWIIISLTLIIVFTYFLIKIYKISFCKRGYALRERDLIYKEGVIAESSSIIPLHRIQHIALNEGFISRMFQLANLEIYTAGGNSGEIVIKGLAIDTAKNLKEIIAFKINYSQQNNA